MSNPFRAAIRGVRTNVTTALDVSDLLLGDLLDRGVISQVKYDQILVRRFTGFTDRAHCFYASDNNLCTVMNSFTNVYKSTYIVER